ncbi:hypothetical protein M434DRAFT_15886 [Hypoxylon sp. CO27-5]|nr:hypothetical protein M434DRAFT_15886 [Hypoxylon sp. CO27-5]
MSGSLASLFPVGGKDASSKFPLQKIGSAGREQSEDLSEGKVREFPIRGFQVPKRKHAASDSDGAPRKRAREASLTEYYLPEIRNKYYIWPEEEAEKIWQQVCPGQEKLQYGGPFYLRFPCERSRLECIIKEIGRSNQLADDRYIHIVWKRETGEFDNHLGWNVFLSPVSRAVNTDDVAFLRPLAWAWSVITYWYGEMLTSRKDVNLASFFEICAHEDLASLGRDEKAERWNVRVTLYDKLAKEQFQDFKETKKAAREHILGLLEASSNLEARKQNLNKWVLDTERHPTLIKRPDFARTVWKENRVHLFDSEDVINDWFWSVTETRELPCRPKDKAPSPRRNLALHPDLSLPDRPMNREKM